MAKNAQSETVVNARIEETVATDRVEEVTIPLQERDEFADPQYLDPDAKLPRIQAVRGSIPKMCGYFVAVNQMAAAGWKDFDEKQLITQYGSVKAYAVLTSRKVGALTWCPAPL